MPTSIDEPKPFIAAAIDTYNKKEYIICRIRNNEYSETRDLGEFFLDISEKNKNRHNPVIDYMSEYKIETEQFILSEKFFEAQKHLSLNAQHRYSSFNILNECFPDKADNINGKLTLLYKNDLMYACTENNFLGLIRYYLDELYSAGIFPRKCMMCDSIFLSGRNHGDVICSPECKKKSNSRNTIAYNSRLSENEILYYKIYRKWRQRIKRAEEKTEFPKMGSPSCVRI